MHEQIAAPPKEPPSGPTVPCPNCSSPVDPLRAARVAMFGDRFYYFCSAECRGHFTPEALATPLPRPHPSTSRPGVYESPTKHVETTATPRTPTSEAAAVPEQEETPVLEEPAEPVTDVGGLLLALAILGGCLSLVLALAGDSAVALTARLIVLLGATAALVSQSTMGGRDPTEMHPAALLSAPALGAIVALATRIGEHPRSPEAISLGALVVTVIAASVWLMRRLRSPIEAARERIAEALDVDARRVHAESVVEAHASDLRPGEEIMLEPGDIAVADVSIVAGSASVRPWLDAKTREPRTVGDTLVAGAQVTDGRLRAVVGWAGLDRAWMRLTHDPRRRADLLAPLARWSRLGAERAAPFALTLAALLAFAADVDLLTIALVVIAAQAAVTNPGIAQVNATIVANAVLEGLQRGIVFRTADALDRAGRVTSTAFCARGTLLLGEPEVANIEPMKGVQAEQVLALVAGAESGANHAVAAATLRAARARGVRPDAVRSPTVQPGLGVTAIASNGEPLVVGSRALMLRERVSVAIAEQKIVDLEAMGRNVMLVALSGRLIGVVGLQDGLRAGARAAVQHLLDAGVEPVLLSGDARETCEALGRALDIEHVRPELLPAERADAVRGLAEGGAVVAVVGRSPADDAALVAADVSVALAAAGSNSAEYSVQLASDDVREASYAIRLARDCRREARFGLLVTLTPGLGAALAVALGLAPPVIAPCAALLGVLAAHFRLRTRT